MRGSAGGDCLDSPGTWPFGQSLWGSTQLLLQPLRQLVLLLEAPWRHLPASEHGTWRLAAGVAPVQHCLSLGRLGWSATDAFGVHPDKPADAIHCGGLAVLLNGSEVVSVSEEAAVVLSRGGSTQSFARSWMPGAVPVWEAGD